MSVGLWVWWAFRCDAMLCGWFALGLIKEELVEEELVEEGKEEMANHRERERKSIVKGKAFEYRVYHVFWLVFFFFFQYCDDVENYGSFKDFGYIYI